MRKILTVTLLLALLASLSACGEKEFTGDPSELLPEVIEWISLPNEPFYGDGYAGILITQDVDYSFDSLSAAFRDEHRYKDDDVLYGHPLWWLDDPEIAYIHDIFNGNVTYRFIRYEENAAVYAGTALPSMEECFQYLGAPDAALIEPDEEDIPAVNDDEEISGDFDYAYAMEQFLLEKLPGVPVQAGSGMGIEISSGIVYNFCYGASEDDYNTMISKLQGWGYTEDIAETQEDGALVYTAWKSDDFYGQSIQVHTKLIFDDGYLEIQIGTNSDQPSHKEKN